MDRQNNRYSSRRVQLNDSMPRFDAAPGDTDAEPQPSADNPVGKLEPFMGVKARRLASFHRDYRGDYLNVSSNPYILKILDKQGDRQVLFSDKVLKFTSTGKMKRRILIVTDFALYVVDPESYTLKRRITLSAVEKLYLSKLSDNFFAIVIPTEYDVLMASTRKTEIVTVLVDAAKNTSNFELDVIFKNRFQYNPAADLVKEVHFEEVEGGVKTKILRKPEDD
ncbi:hypothetical protein SOVF_007900 [Spinacia oleracea]|uniref:TH1 domain-containing protein n=1 Tax=Spinacia oleracea TaxID=3562 RepID=A0A9R0JLZ6_SPIOL|nr:uncharacterized protein LOC110779442 [Spinacia oleracea]KNA25307.1 hypothetical protein SOVF_007900 [Spinacia oleracea]